MALPAVSCTKSPEPQEDPKEPVVKLRYGLDSITFKSYKPLSSKPFKVYSYIPDDEKFNIRTMPILFCMHGASRDGLNQIKYWKATANDKGIILLAPNFTKEVYPSLDYQLGGVSWSSSEYVPKMTELWTYNLIEAIFDYVKESTGNTSKTYYLHGHSAGGQWTHRFLLNMKNHRCAKAVESNAGYYTVPDPKGISNGTRTFCYPYSVKGMFYEEADIKYPLDKYDYMTIDQLKKYFAMDLTVHLGTADTVTTVEQDPNLPVSDGAKAQGKCRYERGHFFYDRAKRIADSLNTPFNWKLVEVKGVGHSTSKMVNGQGTTGAAYILFYQQ